MGGPVVRQRAGSLGAHELFTQRGIPSGALGTERHERALEGAGAGLWSRHCIDGAMGPSTGPGARGGQPGRMPVQPKVRSTEGELSEGARGGGGTMDV
jgi:hypothetical protein